MSNRTVASEFRTETIHCRRSRDNDCFVETTDHVSRDPIIYYFWIRIQSGGRRRVTTDQLRDHYWSNVDQSESVFCSTCARDHLLPPPPLDPWLNLSFRAHPAVKCSQFRVYGEAVVLNVSLIFFIFPKEYLDSIIAVCGSVSGCIDNGSLI